MTRTFGELALEGRDWVLSGVEPQVVIRLKQIFPRIPKAQGGPYAIANEPQHCADLDWFLSRYPLRADPVALASLRKGRADYERRQEAADALLSADYVAPAWVGFKPGSAPRAHQSQAAELLRMVGGLLVGDDVGEGKTFTAMGACMLPGALPAAIVVDPHLQGQWADRFAEHTTLTTHSIRGTKPYAIPPADVRIFRWTQLAGWADYLETIGVGLAAFDECQELRTGTGTARGTAAMRLCRAARLRLGLTATPIYNYGSEIWQVMRFLRPEVLGAHGDFMREWSPSGHVKDPKALGSYLREQHAFVRKRKIGDRVNKLIQVVPHDEDSLASIEQLAQELALTATRGSFTQRGEAVRELDLRVRQQTGIAKAAAVADVARIIVEGGEPIILAGWHRAVYDIWNERLRDLAPAMYTGSETPAEKKRQMARFLNGETDVFILSLRSGRGVDGLQQRCKFVVVGELDWSPQVHYQIIGRVDREGSIIDDTGEKITALFLVAEDGSDPPMMEVNGLKASDAANIIDPDLGLQTVRMDGSGLQRLVQAYLSKRASGAREAAA